MPMSRIASFRARFAYVEERGPAPLLKFAHSEMSLSRLGLGGERPLIDELTVKMPRGMAVDDSIREHVGLDCDVTVRIRPYSFVSNRDYNRGDHVSGVNYELVSVRTIE